MIEKKNQISNNHNTSNAGKQEETKKAMPVKRIPAELKKPAQDKTKPEKPTERT